MMMRLKCLTACSKLSYLQWTLTALPSSQQGSRFAGSRLHKHSATSKEQQKSCKVAAKTFLGQTHALHAVLRCPYPGIHCTCARYNSVAVIGHVVLSYTSNVTSVKTQGLQFSIAVRKRLDL